MEKKNRSLAKKNTELLEEINNLNEIHTEHIKEDIKNKYYTARRFRKILDDLDIHINDLKSLLDNTIKIKEQFVEYSRSYNKNTNSSPKKDNYYFDIYSSIETKTSKDNKKNKLQEFKDNKKKKNKKGNPLAEIDNNAQKKRINLRKNNKN
ncbi:hypothetical protein P3W45_000736 [Vairimorpha bombi]|jgi:hypothetical protein